jgi:hypothetical protein
MAKIDRMGFSRVGGASIPRAFCLLPLFEQNDRLVCRSFFLVTRVHLNVRHACIDPKSRFPCTVHTQKRKRGRVKRVM